MASQSVFSKNKTPAVKFYTMLFDISVRRGYDDYVIGDVIDDRDAAE